MIIDAHAHCTPTAYTEKLARAGGAQRNAEPYPTRPACRPHLEATLRPTSRPD